MKYQLTDFVDIHTHILPGMDDGPEDMEGSVALARCYERVGVKRIVATPHYLPGTAWAQSKEKVLATVGSLQRSLDDANISLKIEPGMEISFHPKLGERIQRGELLPLANSEYFLIEPSFHSDNGELFTNLLRLMGEGRKFILAHPERIPSLQANPEALCNLVAHGMLVQISAGSLLGYFGEHSKVTVDSLYHKQCIHFVASDAHDHKKRSPLTDEEWKNLLKDHKGEGIMQTCCRNIASIFKCDQ